MKFKNYLSVLILATFFLLCMSCACAGDVNQVNNASGTYSELNNDISGLHTGDTYNFSKDYYFKSDGYSVYYPVIDIKADNVTINGNGHVIDAGNDGLTIFKVT